MVSLIVGDKPVRLITRETDYAVRALCFITEGKKERVSVRELGSNLKIPKPFLRKILQILNQEGILKSYKGQRGGFRLARAPERIFLVDLIRIFQGQVKLNECIFKRKICPNKNACLLKEKIDSIERYVVSELKSITIASLLKK